MMTLHDILSAQNTKKHSTANGIKMHNYLRHIVIDCGMQHGDVDLIEKIQTRPELLAFFVADAKTEVPIAGTINGRFISRRIDRMIVDHHAKTIAILDYKTDINPEHYRASYIAQLREYVQLMRLLHPGYEVSAYLLWTHDFLLEKIPLNSL